MRTTGTARNGTSSGLAGSLVSWWGRFRGGQVRPAWLWSALLLAILAVLFGLGQRWTVPSGLPMVLVLSGLAAFLLIGYLSRLSPELLDRNSLPVLVVLLGATAAMGRGVLATGAVSNYAIPIAFFSILAGLIFGTYPAAIGSTVLAVLLGFSGGSTGLTVLLVTSGLVGSLVAPLSCRRTDLTRSGLYVGGAGGLVVLGVSLSQGMPWPAVGTAVAWSVGGGFVSAVLALLALPYLETYFGLATNIRLLELADLQHPLLKRLALEAPGTFHHTITVATLAAVAAESIGANSLLTQVGAYYHDVGKLTRPHFFYENTEFGAADYHRKVTPRLSSRIIISHVTDGADLARIHRLPLAVADIILQHHGTGLMAHFYRKGLQESPPGRSSVTEQGFRYSGPRPRRKEAALVMLADSVEAAFRYSPKKSHQAIINQVEKVINNKIRDGQLDECDLTMRELNRIGDAFTRVLTGMEHNRGRYPEEMLKRREMRMAGSGSDEQNSCGQRAEATG